MACSFLIMKNTITQAIVMYFPNSITDAFNETKDKVKYLDTLKRYLEQLYLPNITIATLSNTVLPGLMATVRQMDAISRYYARTGYLGVLFTKVCNRLFAVLINHQPVFADSW